MDIGVRFLLSPFATAFAAGALFAFCVALLKQRYRPKKRRDSAPESTSRNPEPEFLDSSGLVKYNSVGSLCSNSNTLEDLTTNPLPTISNFPAFDGGRSVPSLGTLPKLRPFTFSDDLINLERKYARLYDAFGTDTPPTKSHSCSLPNFRRLVTRSSKPCFFGGSVYPYFQPFDRHHSHLRDFYRSKSFHGQRRSVSLEYPEVPVVYDPRETSRLISEAAKTVLQSDFKSIDDNALRKSLPCFLTDKDITRKVSQRFSKVPNVRHKFVQFPSTNVALLEYLCSNRECRFPEKSLNDRETSLTYKNSAEYLSFKPGAIEHSIARKKRQCFKSDSLDEENSEGSQENSDLSRLDKNVVENPPSQLADLKTIESSKLVLKSVIINQTKILEPPCLSNTVLESYVQVIKCANQLVELSERDFSNDLLLEKEIKFSKPTNEKTNVKSSNTSPEHMPKTNVENSFSSVTPLHQTPTPEELFTVNSSKIDNLFRDKEVTSTTQVYNKKSSKNEKIINDDPASEVLHSENTSTLENSNSKIAKCCARSKNETSQKEPLPPALHNCHAPVVDTRRKPINNTKMSNFPNENLGNVQKPPSDDNAAKVTPRRRELLLSFSVGGPNDCERTTAAHFGGEEGRDVIRGEAGGAADDSSARQMDRGTRDRSVDARDIVRVLESSVLSETSVDGVIVSSVSVNGTDVWTEVVDTCRSNGVDMSVRTVISTDHSSEQPYKPTKDRAKGLDVTPHCGTEKPVDQYMHGMAHILSPSRSHHLSQQQTSTPLVQPYRPNFEEYMANVDSGLDETANELREIEGRPLVLEESSPPRVTRLLGLLSRDEERRARAQLMNERRRPGDSESIEGEWDRILQDVLASVSELESFGDKGIGKSDITKRIGKENGAKSFGEENGAKTFGEKKDVAKDAEEEDDDLRQTSSTAEMEEGAVPNKGETPTKVKSLRFKLDPDIFDVPSDDSFYDDEDENDLRRPGWRRQQTKYKAFHTLELGDEPVQLVSVHASVVPAGQKMVARPVGIDLRVRLTEERGKRAHVGTSPLQQAKRRSPVSDSRVGWCQELSPVTENVDWRETFTGVNKENNNSEVKPVPNGILKTPSPKAEVVVKDSSNPFKEELTNGNGVHVEKPTKTNGMTPWNPPQKKFSLPRKKFEPDPEAVDRITGYKVALSKPPLPPPVFQKMTTPPSMRNRAEIARKQYLDNKAALSAASKSEGSRKFQQFLVQAQSDRARIVTSVPDLAAIERAVHEKWSKERGSASPRASPAREDGQKLAETPSSRGSTPDDAWSSYVQTCRKHLGRRSQSMTYLETDVDLVPVEDEDKWRSTSALDQPDDHQVPVEDSDLEQSREDLDDSGRAKSEHELRIQKSLQSLPLPDWYKRSDKPKTGFLLKASEKEKRGWAAAKSLASSTSSLASCGIKRPVHSLRSSRENIPWSRGSASPDGPALSLALAKAFREPYLGWRARTSTTSSGVSSSPPSSWCAATTDEEANGISFDGEDAFGRTSSEDPPSPDDTGADAVTVSMDTGDLVKLPGGEDTCDDINNMSMDTCEIFDGGFVPEDPSIVPGESSPLADTGDDIDNLSTDTATEDKRKNLSMDTTTEDKRENVTTDTTTEDKRKQRDTTTEDKRKNLSTDTSSEDKRKKDPKSKRYSYSQSIYNSEWDDDEESRGDRKGRNGVERDPSPTSPDSKVIWIESSFVGSRTTTSIVVLPEGRESKVEGDCIERPASR